MASKSQWGQLSCPVAKTTLKITSPNPYADVSTWLAANPKGKVAGRTFASRRDNGAIDVKLYDTTIVSYRRDGVIVLNSGGFRTQTTQSMIRMLLPPGWKMWTDKGAWFIQSPVQGERVAFKDGMMLLPSGMCDKYDTVDDATQFTKDVSRYVRGYIKALFDGQIPQPFAELDTKKIREYVRTSHFFPGLITEALIAYDKPGIDMPAIDSLWGGTSLNDKSDDTIRRALRPESPLNEHRKACARRDFTVALRRYIKSQVGLVAYR